MTRSSSSSPSRSPTAMSFSQAHSHPRESSHGTLQLASHGRSLMTEGSAEILEGSSTKASHVLPCPHAAVDQAKTVTKPKSRTCSFNILLPFIFSSPHVAPRLVRGASWIRSSPTAGDATSAFQYSVFRAGDGQGRSQPTAPTGQTRSTTTAKRRGWAVAGPGDRRPR